MGNNQHVVNTLVDPGSACNLMSVATLKKLGAEVLPSAQRVVGFNGTCSQAMGKVKVMKRIGDQQRVTMYQAPGERTQMILGYLVLKKFGFTVDCSEDCLCGEGGMRILCHVVVNKEEGRKGDVVESQSPPFAHRHYLCRWQGRKS